MQQEPQNESVQEPPKADPNLVELLAFNLLYVKRLDLYAADAEQLAREAWQDDAGVRYAYRLQARQLIATLEEDGARLRSSDGKAVARKLVWMQTIPPRQAYSADELLT